MKLTIPSDAIFNLFPRSPSDDTLAVGRVVGSDKKTIKLEVDKARVEFDINGNSGVIAVGQDLTFNRVGEIIGEPQFVTGGRTPKAEKPARQAGSSGCDRRAVVGNPLLDR